MSGSARSERWEWERGLDHYDPSQVLLTNERHPAMQPMTPVTDLLYSQEVIDPDPTVTTDELDATAPAIAAKAIQGFDPAELGWDDDPRPGPAVVETVDLVNGIDVGQIQASVTSHVAAILDTIETRTGEIPSGAWWDHALMVAGHPRWDPTTTSTIHLTPHETPATPTEDDDGTDTPVTDLDGLRPLIGVLVAVSLAALILAGVALVAAF